MKLPHLESLRGLAALAVVAAHLVWAFATPPPPANPKRAEWPAGVARLPEPARTLAKVGYWTVKQGRGAVFVFFALSGLVLARSYLRSGRGADLRAGVFRRWPRLALPAVVASLAAWGVGAAGWRQTAAAGRAQTAAGVSPLWLDATAAPPGGAWVAFRQASYDLYFRATPTLPAELFNPALWTMRVEFFGSLVVFAFLGVFGGHRRLIALSASGALILGLLGQVELGLFLGGVALSAILVERPHWLLPGWLGLALLAAGVTLGGTYGGYDGRVLLMPGSRAAFRPGEVRVGLGALAVVAAVALTPRLARVLSARPLVWLGGVSFGVYLVHMVALTTAGAACVARLTPSYGWPLALLVASVATVGLSVVGGWVVTVLVDRPAVALARRVGRAALGN